MLREYKVSIGMKLLYGLGSFGMFLFFLWLSTAATIKGIIPSRVITFSFFCFSILVIINIFKRKVIISENDIECMFPFSTRRMEFSDIKGVRVEDKIIIIESLTETIKPITIANYIDLKNSDELREWIQNNFKDLNAIDLKNQHQQLLNDEGLGDTQDEGLRKLKQAKAIAIIYNVGATVLGFAMIFIDSVLSLYVLLILPLIGLCIFYFSYGLTKFITNYQRSIYRQVGFGILLSCFWVLLNSFPYRLFELKNLWVPSLVVMCIFFLLLYTKGINKSIGNIKEQMFCMLVVAMVYGFGAIRSVNCKLDNSNKKTFNATILEHRVSRGKSTSYLLTLSPWGQQTAVEEFEVSRKLYYDVFVGDTVEVQLKEGLLQIPWFNVKKRVLSNP